MIIQTKILQESCKKILDAVDSTSSSIVTETLELEIKDSKLYLNVTNNSYFVSVKMPVETDLEFHAVVDAKTFLSLISKITTSNIELTIKDNALLVKGNGNYKLPLIFDGDELLKLPKIYIDNITNDFDIENSFLQSILKYNAKELQKGVVRVPVQELFYIDNKGCITFTTGACVTEFDLPQPVVITLTEKIVKLFKLFKSETIAFLIGHDEVEGGKLQTKVAFQDESVLLVAILNTNSSLLNQFPVAAIRGRANEDYAHSVVLDKGHLLDAINRLSVFVTKNSITKSTFIEFSSDAITVYNNDRENSEVIPLPSKCNTLVEPYTAKFYTPDLKLTLESCDEQFITVSFGNHRAVTISRKNVKNVLPEQVI
jgi:hypothetical protein